ncbi:MAG: ABC transporter permease [Bacteroidales bacterium]|nr:ABC transporter permease [Bacteroidales bacterium]
MNRFKDTLIKILSLGIGLAIGIVLIAKVCFELSYDSFYKDIDRLYLIDTHYEQQGEKQDFAQTSGAVAPGFKAEVPGVEEATRYTFHYRGNRYLDEENNVVTGSLVLADSCFFKVFDRPILAGNPVKVLAKPRYAMVSESFAKKLGGVSECIGKSIANEDDPRNKFIIDGVYKDFPENGNFHFDIIGSLELLPAYTTDNWNGNDRYFGFVKLQKGVDYQSLGEAIRKMQEAHQPLDEYEKNGVKLWYYLEPFNKLHTSQSYVHSMVVLLTVTAALLIIISLLNYILIVISSLVRRAKEIGVRKCYGADSFDIHWLLAREAFMHLILSLVLAAAIIFAAKGLIINLLDVPFETLLISRSIWVISLVLVFVLIVSVFVPAQLFMRIPVSVAFRNYTENSRRWKIGLLGVQVFINVFIVVMLIVVALQYQRLNNHNPGYDYKNLYYMSFYNGNKGTEKVVAETLMQFSEVKGVEASNALPIRGFSGDNVYLPGDDRELFNVADGYEVTPGYFDLLGIEFIEGHKPADISEMVVSESFVKRMKEFADWSDGAVGKVVNVTGHEDAERVMEQKGFTISGVYRDIQIGNLVYLDARPSVLFYGDFEDDSYMPFLIFKTNGKLDEASMQKITSAVLEVLNGKEVHIISWADNMRSAYDDSLKMRNTVLIGSVFALMIAIIGLIGFVRDESNRRSKEMAIRKINGATAADVLKIFAWDVLKLSLVLSVAACIFTYFVAHKWLEQFAERIGLSPLYFLVGALFVILIVTIVVVLSSNRVARMNPVKSLKNN